MELLARSCVDSSGQLARLDLIHLHLVYGRGLVLNLSYPDSTIWLLLHGLGDFHGHWLRLRQRLLLFSAHPGVLAAVVRHSVDALGLLGLLAQPALRHQRRHPLVHLKVGKAWDRPHRLPQHLVRLFPGRDWAGLCSCRLHLGFRLLRHGFAGVG